MSRLTLKETQSTVSKKVDELEKVRNKDRSYKTWFELKKLKKEKLKLKDKINAAH